MIDNSFVKIEYLTHHLLVENDLRCHHKLKIMPPPGKLFPAQAVKWTGAIFDSPKGWGGGQ